MIDTKFHYCKEDQLIYAKNIWNAYSFAIEKDDPTLYKQIICFLYNDPVEENENLDEKENDLDSEATDEVEDKTENEEDGFENEFNQHWHVEISCTIGDLMESEDYERYRIYYFNDLLGKDYSEDEEIPPIPDEEIDLFMKYFQEEIVGNH
jgi:hypothetical protein